MELDFSGGKRLSGLQLFTEALAINEDGTMSIRVFAGKHDAKSKKHSCVPNFRMKRLVAVFGLTAALMASAAEIEFKYPLPRRLCEGERCGLYNNPELSLPGALTTSGYELGMFLHKLRINLMSNRRLLFIDGKVLVCNHNWIRDHVHDMKGWCHWEHDPLSFLQFIIDTQREDGQFFELVKQMDDNHWKFVDESCRRLYPDDHLSLVRLELEADVEFLVVEGAMTYYRITGDDAWLAKVLPSLEKGIDYQTSDPKRWSEKYGLAIRLYTIDTWDFTHDEKSAYNRTIFGPMCAMHGDNTGVYQAMNQLAWMNDRLGRRGKASEWRKRAETLKANVMKHLWNGRFFTHQFPVDGNPPYDGNETNRLSLSDAYALNRGFLTGDQCRSVVDAFQERRKCVKSFAEWFTIDPPYSPKFMKYAPGEYLNGAISPFTAGELAKGAFLCGREEYGWDIISRMMKLVERDGDIYFLYDPVTEKPQGGGPSAWGAAALMSAVDEGLAGVVNAGVGYDVMEFSPRWPVTGYTELRYVTGYEMTKKYVDVRWVLDGKGMRYNLKSPSRKIVCHLLLPKGRKCSKLLVDGVETPFREVAVDASDYVDFEVDGRPSVDFEVLFRQP